MEKNWREIITRGAKTEEKMIRIKEKRIEKPPPKPKDKLDLVLEGIERCEKKIDKLKKDKGA